jgi:hypothetical protein
VTPRKMWLILTFPPHPPIFRSTAGPSVPFSKRSGSIQL